MHRPNSRRTILPASPFSPNNARRVNTDNWGLRHRKADKLNKSSARLNPTPTESQQAERQLEPILTLELPDNRRAVATIDFESLPRDARVHSPRISPCPKLGPAEERQIAQYQRAIIDRSTNPARELLEMLELGSFGLGTIYPIVLSAREINSECRNEGIIPQYLTAIITALTLTLGIVMKIAGQKINVEAVSRVGASFLVTGALSATFDLIDTQITPASRSDCQNSRSLHTVMSALTLTFVSIGFLLMLLKSRQPNRPAGT